MHFPAAAAAVLFSSSSSSSVLQQQQQSSPPPPPPPPIPASAEVEKLAGSRGGGHQGLGGPALCAGPTGPIRDPTHHSHSPPAPAPAPAPPPSGNVINVHSLLSYTLALSSPKEKYNNVFNFCDAGEGVRKVRRLLVDDFYRMKQMIESYFENRFESALVMQKLTAEQEAAWKAATECYVCGDPFVDFEQAGISRTKFFNLKAAGKLQWTNPHNKDTFVPYALLRGVKVHDHDHDTG